MTRALRRLTFDTSPTSRARWINDPEEGVMSNQTKRALARIGNAAMVLAGAVVIAAASIKLEDLTGKKWM